MDEQINKDSTKHGETFVERVFAVARILIRSKYWREVAAKEKRNSTKKLQTKILR